MCLNKEINKIFKTQKDMVVFCEKYWEKGRLSPVFQYKENGYVLGQLYVAENMGGDYYDDYPLERSGIGFYAFPSLKDAITYREGDTETKIAMGIVPKGTRYVKGQVWDMEAIRAEKIIFKAVLTPIEK